MSKVTTITFTGESGRKYTFDTYEKSTKFNDVSAVYIFTKRYVTASGGYSQIALYVGETRELGTRIGSHEQWPCVERNGCTHISIMQVSGSQQRLDIETDLIHSLNPVCNRQ